MNTIFSVERPTPSSPVPFPILAFQRNRGLISSLEQEKLRHSRVAIAGQGGVGGVHLVTLARLGIGHFTIADPDVFELSNINRQYGSSMSTCGLSKVQVMSNIVKNINPAAEVHCMSQAVGADNIEEFLDGADLFIDGIDAFNIKVRRFIYQEVAKRDLYAIAAGPVGFSAAWLLFDPRGMDFDTYFNLSDEMDPIDEFVSFIIGTAPKAAQRSYLDLAYLDMKEHVGPSVSTACALAAGAAGAEAVKILLKRGNLRPVPEYHQMDPYLGKFYQGRLWGGNRHPMQRLKRWWLSRYLRKHPGV